MTKTDEYFEGVAHGLKKRWTKHNGEAADFLDYLGADSEVPGQVGSAIEVIDSGRHFVTFSWTPLKQVGSEPILAYRVEICRQGDDEWTQIGVSPTSSIDAFHVVRGQDVRLRITARNRHGWGNPRVTDAVRVPPHEAALPQFVVGLPSRLTRLIGDSLVFTCEVQSLGPVTISWFLDAVPIAEDDDRISVSRCGNVSHLTLRDLKPADSGRYTCEAENGSGKAQSHGNLVVGVSPESVRIDRKTEKYQPGEHRAPEFWLRLRDRQIDVGELVRLSCRVFGVPLPEVSWKKDGKSIRGDQGRLSLLNDGPYHTLEIRDAMPEDAGEYEAIAESPLGEVTTKCVVSALRGLHGYKTPTFHGPIEPPKEVTPGGDLRLMARVTGFPVPKVQWFRNGDLLRPTRHCIMTYSPDGDAVLTVANISQRDMGRYDCLVVNSFGSASESVTVNFPMTNGTNCANGDGEAESSDLPYSKEPAFISRPISIEVMEGDPLDIICEVVGDPRPDVVLEKDFLKAKYYKSAVCLIREESGPLYRFHVPVATFDLTGCYAVVARNVHGEAKAVMSLQVFARGQGKDTAAKSQLTVQQTLPKILSPLKDVQCTAGESTVLECQVGGSPEPDVLWYKGSKLVRLGGETVTADVDVAGRTYLRIGSVTPGDTGEYRCVAKNILGTASTTANLAVNGAGSERSSPQKTSGGGISRSLGQPSKSPPPCRRYAPPRFLSVPHDRAVDLGSTVRLQCAASGMPEPTATWFHDDRAILDDGRVRTFENDDIRILEINRVRPEDAGEYTVRLTNPHGHVDVFANLIVIGQRPNHTRGNTPYIAGKPSHGKSRGPTAVSHASTTPTRIPARNGGASKGIYDAVAPIFTRKLPPVTAAIEGQPLELFVEIRGSSVMTVHWYRAGVLLPPSEEFEQHRRGLRFVLRLRDVYSHDAGEYCCEAINSVGARMSCTGAVRVRSRSRSATRPHRSPLMSARSAVGVRRSVTQKPLSNGARLCPPSVTSQRTTLSTRQPRFQVPATKSRQPTAVVPSTSLSSNSVNLKPYAEKVMKPIPEPKSATLHQTPDRMPVHSKEVPKAAKAQSRPELFEPKIRNEQSTSPLRREYIIPVTLEDFDPLTITEIDSDSIASSKFDLEYDVESPDEASETTEGHHLNPVDDLDQSDRFSPCRVRSVHSDVESDPGADLGLGDEEPVERKPQSAVILKGPEDVTVLRGAQVELEVCFTGWPPPQVRWLQKGRTLCSAPNGRFTVETSEGVSRLRLNNISGDDSGKYVVAVSNEYGDDSYFASVAVEGPPDPPAGQPSISVTENPDGTRTALVAWSSPHYDGGCCIRGYRVESSTDNQWQVVASDCHALSISVPIPTGHARTFRVRAENRHGLSEPGLESAPVIAPECAESATTQTDKMEDAHKPVEVQPAEEFSEKYEILEELGKGRYGVVHLVQERDNPEKRRAAKLIRTIKAKDREQVQQEISIMNSLKHPKLLQLLGAYESIRETIMILEYISGGELFERVVADDFTLTERDCVLFVRQICDGVAYMHSKRVVHLDLKPENIMCQSRNSHHIKLIDFGLARHIEHGTEVRVLFGTPEFIPPEIISYEPIGTASDMWSVGVICYVLLSGLSPFMGENDVETFANITRAELDFDDEAFATISNEARNFISCLLIKRMEKRLSANECLNHPWLTQLETSVSCVALSTDKLKKFIIRRKWQKTGNAIRALGRMTILSAASRRNSAGSTNSVRSNLRNEEIVSNKSESTRSQVLSDRSDSGISDCSTSSIRNAPSVSAFANDCISEENEDTVSLKNIIRPGDNVRNKPASKTAVKTSIEDKIRSLELEASTPKPTKTYLPEKLLKHEDAFVFDDMERETRSTHIEGVPLSKANGHSASFQKTLAFWKR